jgi:hypothetical protein
MTVITALVALMVIAVPFVIHMRMGYERSRAHNARSLARNTVDSTLQFLEAYLMRTTDRVEMQNRANDAKGDNCDPTVDTIAATVDKDALRTALADPSTRDYFIDLMLIRQLTRDMGPTRFVAPSRQHGPLRSIARWAAAILILTAGAAGGYAHGQRSQAAASAASSFEVVIDNTPTPGAPEPTRVIRFEPGVNWTSDIRSH